MGPIIFTEDRDEMISIGKKIASEKKEKYSDGMFRLIRSSIEKRVSDRAAIDDLVYITIYHYWAYGVSVDEYFYYGFADKTHEEKQKYMTFQFRMEYGKHLNELSKAHLLMNKYETYSLFTEEFKRDLIPVRSKDDYSAFLRFSEKHPEFVVKPIDMGGGRGVHKASVAGMDEAQRRALFEVLLEEGQTNRAKYLRGQENSLVLEEIIDQADEMKAFNPESINSVRVNTILKDDKVLIYEPWFKIGRGGNFLTSAVFGTLDAGIDAESGIVNSLGFTELGEIWEKHPDCGIPIMGFQVPQWQELKEFAEKCARRLPFFTYVGWDFALSKRGWCIMEGNYCGDFMWQLFRQRGMRKEFEELIGWRLDREFWWQK